jgi:hypothetical protein
MSTDYIDRNMGHLGALCADAAGGGYVEVLMYLREQSCPWGERYFLEAAAGGQLETLKWLRANGCPSGDADPGFEGNTRIAGPAAQHGHLEVLTWLQENGYELDGWACAYAAKGNQLETLQWLFANGCPYNEETCAWAAIEGHVDVLEYAMAEGVECGEYTCASVAERGTLDMIIWLRERDIPWDEDMLYACRGSNPMFWWAVKNGCPGSEKLMQGPDGRVYTEDDSDFGSDLGSDLGGLMPI